MASIAMTIATNWNKTGICIRYCERQGLPPRAMLMKPSNSTAATEATATGTKTWVRIAVIGSLPHVGEEPRVAAAPADAHAEADRRFISAVAGQANSATHSVAKRIRLPGLAEVAARVQHREVCRELRRGVGGLL